MNCAEHTTRQHATPSRPQPGAVDWRDGLPVAWRLRVVTPLSTDCHKEYEMHAVRCLGHDEDGALCFYAHDYAIPALRSDDDESYYTVVDQGERLRAWRLRDGRWLQCRTRLRHDDPSPARPVYTFGEQPPR